MSDILIFYNSLLPHLNLFNILKLKTLNKCFYHMFKLLKFNELSIKFDKNDKIGKFNFLVYHFSYLPKQGSREWLLQRNGLYKDEVYDYINLEKSFTVGGSEISTLLFKNAYSSVRTLASKKLYPGSGFKGSIDTRWGNLFEPVITKFTENYFKTTIYEFGSLPIFYKNFTPISRYSPDGISVIKNENLFNYDDTFNLLNIENDIKFNKNNIVLFEFKCPMRRKIKNEVPDHYINQPLIGMCGINIIDFSIFGDGVFRKCSVNDFLIDEKYDKTFHSYDWRTEFTKPIMSGVIILYENNSNEFNENKNNIINTINNKISIMKNIGSNVIDIIDTVFNLCKKNNIYDIKYIKDIFKNNFSNDINYNINIKYIELIYKYYSNQYDLKLLKKYNDLGDSFKNSIDYFEKLMIDVDNNILNIKYNYNFYNIDSGITKQEYLFKILSKYENKYENLYVIPYKLFDIRYIPIKKNNKMKEIYYNSITNFTNKLNNIKQFSNKYNFDTEFPVYDSDHMKYIKKYGNNKNIKNKNNNEIENEKFISYTKNGIMYSISSGEHLEL